MSKYSKIKTGVIGIGSMGQNHVRHYSALSNLIGIADLDEKAGRETAEKYGISWFRHHKDLLKEIDAVTIAVPTKYHLDIAEDAAKAGVNILVEKPLSNNYKDAEKIVQLSDKYSVNLSVGHIERYNPVTQYLKNFLGGNKCGRIFSLSSRRFSPYPARISDVGVSFDLTMLYPFNGYDLVSD